MMMRKRAQRQQQQFVQIQVPLYWNEGEAVYFPHGNQILTVHCPAGTRPGDVLNVGVPPRCGGLVKALMSGIVQEVKAGILQGLRESVAQQVTEDVNPLINVGAQGFASLFFGDGGSS